MVQNRLITSKIIVILIACCVVLLLHLPPSLVALTLHTTTATNLGNWGEMDICPTKTWVLGMAIKVESMQFEEEDNTALNGIRLFCGYPGEQMTWIQNDNLTEIDASEGFKLNASHNANLQSFFGPWGKWHAPQFCSDPSSVAVGFRLQFSAKSVLRDAVGGTNFQLLCSGTGNDYILEGNGPNWGEWTPIMHCDKRQGICGLRTQVHVSIQNSNLKNCWHQESKGTVDQMALTNVQMECCEVASPAENCSPEDKWVNVAHCSNATICSFSKHVGISDQDTKRKNWQMPIYHNSEDESRPGPEFNNFHFLQILGFTKSSILNSLSANFGRNMPQGNPQGKSTGFAWKNYTFPIKIIHTGPFSFHYPPNYSVEIEQLKGICGPFVISTERFRRIYINNDDSSNTVYIIEETSDPFVSVLDIQTFAKGTVSAQLSNLGEMTDWTYLVMKNETVLSNESNPWEVLEEMKAPSTFVVYLIFGLILGPILGVFVVIFAQKLCVNVRQQEVSNPDSSQGLQIVSHLHNPSLSGPPVKTRRSHSVSNSHSNLLPPSSPSRSSHPSCGTYVVERF